LHHCNCNLAAMIIVETNCPVWSLERALLYSMHAQPNAL